MGEWQSIDSMPTGRGPLGPQLIGGEEAHVTVQSFDRKTFSGPVGRPRKAGISRYPSGQPKHVERGEKPEDVLRTAVEARMRLLSVERKDARNPLLGSAMGRLRLLGTQNGGISGPQYGAGLRFARCMSLQAILDDVRPAYGIPVLAKIACASGRDPYERFDPDLAWDATDERRRLQLIGQVRQDASEATGLLWEMQRDHPGTAYIITRITMWDDLHVLDGSHAKMGALRCGLNALARLWIIGDGY